MPQLSPQSLLATQQQFSVIASPYNTVLVYLQLDWLPAMGGPAVAAMHCMVRSALQSVKQGMWEATLLSADGLVGVRCMEPAGQAAQGRTCDVPSSPNLPITAGLRLSIGKHVRMHLTEAPAQLTAHLGMWAAS